MTTPQDRRDGAVLALLDAGLTPREVAALRMGHVRIFANGRGGVQVAWRSPVDRSERPRFVALSEAQAGQVARWIVVDRHGTVDPHEPLFPSKRSGRLRERAIRLLRSRCRRSERRAS